MTRNRESRIINAEQKRKPDGIFVANELYTAGELDKFYLTLEEEQKMFELVVIPKNKVYWFFGCRFAMEEAEEKKGEKKDRSKTEKIFDEYNEVARSGRSYLQQHK